ncbi:hypothetical protein [Maribacter ulvicola]|uniref:Uncharacterized protein n=1 Tax=Maribacter ulvicola TaxID=228959 RepID=A0A1N6TZM3_9FLAO|nr:hypothetical protein [Maribacter ulvicola]SIQ58774.1 hypothetical protein SAMN05421797_102145 [Maribacter ulvicola]
MNSWKTKIKIDLKLDAKTELLSGNSMGIYFEYDLDKTLIVHFKPLNEVFGGGALLGTRGILINFERDLIDEDDIEYA